MRKEDLLQKTFEKLEKDGIQIDILQLRKIFETILICIKESLIEGNHIEIRGFGTFLVRDRSNRTAWNPVKREKFKVEGKKVPYFKAGTIFKKEILQGHLFEDKEDMEG